MNLKILLLGFILIPLTENFYGQQSAISTGGDITSIHGTVSYSIGQVVYNHSSSSEHSITQGVQQSYSISANGGDDTIILTYFIHPNPTTDYLTLSILNYNNENLFYKLSDTQGRLIKHKEITQDKTTIDMLYLASSTYHMTVFNDLKILKSFKIIKN